MVKNRDNLWILSLHALIHFALMVVLIGQSRLEIWPYLLLITIFHLIQDRIKNTITSKHPKWIRVGFIIDQLLHFATIWAITWWFRLNSGSVVATETPFWAIVIMTYVCVTFVWFIIERIFNFTNTEYLHYINKAKTSRMLSRASFLSVFLLIWRWPPTALALSLFNPYPQSMFRRRAVLTDASVSLVAMIFLFWALR
jgi:hypothetical protein